LLGFVSLPTFIIHNVSADLAFGRIQSLSQKEFALAGPICIGLRMSEDAMSADLSGTDNKSLRFQPYYIHHSEEHVVPVDGHHEEMTFFPLRQRRIKGVFFFLPEGLQYVFR
jgi:hypothetical protein